MTEPTNDSKPAELPRFRSTTGKPVMLSLTKGGHSVSVTHLAEGTPLHPRFHRVAVLQGCMPAGMETSIAQESVQAARNDRAAVIRSAIADMVSIATEDPTQEKALFTNDGRPDANELAKRCGFPVKASERDSAWKAYAGDEVEDDDAE